MSERIIALAKGELGKQVENYLQGYRIFVKLEGRPLVFEQRIGNCVFRPMQSKDVPWYVAERADYGITGEDLAIERMAKYRDIRIVGKLGFGAADLVVFSRKNISQQRRVAVPYYYRNIAARLFPEYNIMEVSGSTEGFIVDGTADFGIDITTYLKKPKSEKGKTTLAANSLKVVKRIMSTEAVLISKNSPDYTMEDFETTLRNASN